MRCSSNINSFSDWMNDEANGLIKSIQNENFKIEIQYKPQEFLVSIENEGISNEQFIKKLKEKKELQYFNIKLQSNTGEPMLKTAIESEEEKNLRLQYYIGDFEKDIFLIDGNDTLSCSLYHFERTYGIVPFNNISVAFENVSQGKNDKTLVILDRALGFGVQQFKFKKKDIYNIPQLNN